MKKVVIALTLFFSLFVGVFSAGVSLNFEDNPKLLNQNVSSPGSNSTVTTSLIYYDSDSADSTDSTVSSD